MNKEQIKAELRRSACEDENPLYELGTEAYIATLELRIPSERLGYLNQTERRIFFLIVAEAL